MGQLLSHPLTEKTIIYNDYNNHGKQSHENHTLQKSTHNRWYFNCVGSMQGYRLTQEDAHVIKTGSDNIRIDFYDPFQDKVVEYRVSIFGVFDGHGDNNCSNYLAGSLFEHRRNSGLHAKAMSEHDGLPYFIHKTFKNHKYTSVDKPLENRRQFKSLEGLISQLIKDSFIQCDFAYHRHFANEASGSTAVVALIINESMLYVANTGDSRCVLSKKNKALKPLSFDHKPQHIGELIRINDDGGTVSLGRVGGVLALSRAFGDFQFKSNVKFSSSAVSSMVNSHKKYIPPEESQVTVEPEVIPHRIDFSQDEFLVLACDGIWDVYSNISLVNFIKYHLTLGLKLDEIMTKLLDHGLSCANSSTGVGFDNMTIVIVILNQSNETIDEWYSRTKFRLAREKGLI